jgi:hypothetical protein
MAGLVPDHHVVDVQEEGSRRLTRDEECDRILERYGTDDFERLSTALERQFETLHHRAQLLLGVCGVLISASVLVLTGRLIGRFSLLTGSKVGPALVLAGALATGAAGVVCTIVLRIRWITAHPGRNLRAWILSTLRYRDGKAAAYRISVVMVALSMASFHAAMSVALVNY